MMRENRCIMCGEHKNGLEVIDDNVIRGIRWVKEKLGRKTGFRLVVCKECYANYRKARKKFEGRLKLYLALGVLMAILLITINPLSGVVFGSMIVVFMYFISLLTYVPRVSIPGKAVK